MSENSSFQEKLIPYIKLESDSTKINLEDYIIDLNLIVELRVCDEILIKHTDCDNIKELVYEDSKLPLISVFSIITEKNKLDLILEKSQKVSYKVYFDNKYINYNKVQIAGDFNNWNPEKNNLWFNGNSWECELYVNPGRLSYQFVVDGNWILDPNNKNKVSNNMGGLNSALYIGFDNLEKAPILDTYSYNKNEIIISYKNYISKIYLLLNNEVIQEEVLYSESGNYKFHIPFERIKNNRANLRIIAYNNFAISNELLIPFYNNSVIANTSCLCSKDNEFRVIYFLIIDRFCNSNGTNKFYIKDTDIDDKFNFHGGDFHGVIKKLEEGYFENLGINTIWISPVCKNTENAYYEYPPPHRKVAAYHGYWPISSTEIDNRFGSEKDFNKLIEKIHEQKMDILLDFVSNHVHEDHSLITENPEWATELSLADGKPNIRLWDTERLTTWFDVFLPTIDYNYEEAVEKVSNYAMYWIEKYEIDGFRHDATKHVPDNFWRALTKKLKQFESQKKENIFQIGETFGSRELIGSYVNCGMLDSQFDFNLYFDARAVFAIDDESFEKLDYSLKETLMYYGNHHLMGNISGNHDLTRFISYADGSVSFTENDKEAGWERRIEVKQKIAFKKLISLLTFITTIPGIPVIYYGDEIGMPGANDPDNRRMMKFDNLSKEELDVKNSLAKLIKCRKNRLSLIYGEINCLLVSDKQYVFYRKYFDEVTIVLFNKSNKKADLNIGIKAIVDSLKIEKSEALFETKYSIKGELLKISLSANSSEIISIN